MKYNRIHIFGASGTGTTTLGRRISKEMGIKHFETDDYFWDLTDPPYQRSRELRERQRFLITDLKENERWVLSGSLCGWGDVAIKLFELVIFPWVPTDIRISRLKRRETERFDETDLGPGGKMYKNHRAFIEWAKGYDDGGLDMRSKACHENWLEKIDCDIIRYEGEKSFDEIMEDLTTECT